MAVIDASALAGWLLPEEAGPDIPSLLRKGQAIAPRCFRGELRNILVVIERKGRIDTLETAGIPEAIDAHGISFDTEADSGRVVSLARKHGLAACDSTYPELAIHRREPLASLDTASIGGVRAEEVDLP